LNVLMASTVMVDAAVIGRRQRMACVDVDHLDEVAVPTAVLAYPRMIRQRARSFTRPLR